MIKEGASKKTKKDVGMIIRDNVQIGELDKKKTDDVNMNICKHSDVSE